MSRLPVGIQVYGLRDLLENTPDNFKNVMQQIKVGFSRPISLAGGSLGLSSNPGTSPQV